jgi:hypothetical protein
MLPPSSEHHHRESLRTQIQFGPCKSTEAEMEIVFFFKKSDSPYGERVHDLKI